MDKFIDVLCNSNLTALVIDGIATPEQLAENWTNVFYEYCDLVDATEMKLKARLLAKFVVKQKRYELAKGLVTILEFYQNEAFVKAIIELGFEAEFDGENYERFIARTKAMLVTESLRIEILENEVNEFVNKSTTESGIKEQYFQTIFIALSKYMGYALRFKDVTVAEYAAILKSYTADIEAKKDQLKK